MRKIFSKIRVMAISAIIGSSILCGNSLKAQENATTSEQQQTIEVRKNEKKGTYGYWNNQTESWLIKPEFTVAYPFVPAKIGNSSQEVAFVEKKGKWMLVDRQGKKIAEYMNVKEYTAKSPAVAVQDNNGNWGYFGIYDNPNSSFVYADVMPIPEGSTAFVKTPDGNYGIVFFGLAKEPIEAIYSRTINDNALYNDPKYDFWCALSQGNIKWITNFISIEKEIESEGLHFVVVKTEKRGDRDIYMVFDPETASPIYSYDSNSYKNTPHEFHSTGDINVEIAPMNLGPKFSNPDILAVTVKRKISIFNINDTFFFGRNGAQLTPYFFDHDNGYDINSDILYMGNTLYNNQLQPIFNQGKISEYRLPDDKHIILKRVYGILPDYTVDGVIDKKGNFVVPFEKQNIYENKDNRGRLTGYTIAKFENGEWVKYLTDLDFNVLGSNNGDFAVLSKDVAVMRKGNKWAYADPQTKQPLSGWFDDFKLDATAAAALNNTPNVIPVGPVASGLCEVHVGNKIGVYDVDKKKLVVPIAYDAIGMLKHGIIPVRLNGKYGHVNLQGKVLTPIKYINSFAADEVSPFGVCMAVCLSESAKSAEYALIDLNGKIVKTFREFGHRGRW